MMIRVASSRRYGHWLFPSLFRDPNCNTWTIFSHQASELATTTPATFSGGNILVFEIVETLTFNNLYSSTSSSTLPPKHPPAPTKNMIPSLYCPFLSSFICFLIATLSVVPHDSYSIYGQLSETISAASDQREVISIYFSFHTITGT